MAASTVEELIHSQPLEIRQIARTLRQITQASMPGAFESVYHTALSYSASPSVYHRLVYIAMEKDYVRLGFNFGAYLPDPQHLLVGEGKRLRHVKIHSEQQADLPEVGQLIIQAWVNRQEHINLLK